MANEYDDLIQQAYASIGRSGVGEGVNQIDQGGLNYWRDQLESGALNPQDFQQTFTGAVQNALADQSTANNAQYQYIQNYLAGNALPEPAAPPAPYVPQEPTPVYEPAPVYQPAPVSPPPQVFDDLSNRVPAAPAQPAGGLNAVSSEINQMYRDVLGHDADAEGLQYWTQRFGGPLTADDRALWMSIAKPGSNFDANQVTALGDSTTWGYNSGNRVGTNMTDTAQQVLSQDLGRDIQINNMGVNGSSLGDAIARGDVNKALNDNSPTLLLNYGMNEAYRNEDPRQFQQNLESVVREAKAAGKDVVLQTPNYTEFIPGVNKYADIIRNVADKYGVSLHDKWDLTSGLYNTYDKNDLVHPTQEVYGYLGTTLADILKGKYHKA